MPPTAPSPSQCMNTRKRSSASSTAAITPLTTVSPAAEPQPNPESSTIVPLAKPPTKRRKAAATPKIAKPKQKAASKIFVTKSPKKPSKPRVRRKPTIATAAASGTSDPNCCICFEIIKVRGELDSCKHEFCYDCIDKWSGSSNTCPLCKRRFSQLTKINGTRKSKPKSVATKDMGYDVNAIMTRMMFPGGVSDFNFEQIMRAHSSIPMYPFHFMIGGFHNDDDDDDDDDEDDDDLIDHDMYFHSMIDGDEDEDDEDDDDDGDPNNCGCEHCLSGMHDNAEEYSDDENPCPVCSYPLCDEMCFNCGRGQDNQQIPPLLQIPPGASGSKENPVDLVSDDDL